MSADATSRLILGIKVPRSVFWSPGDSNIQCCNGHLPFFSNMKFCPECGQEFRNQSLDQPTELLQTLTKWADEEDPGSFWDAWCEGRTMPLFGFGLFPVHRITDLDPREDHLMIIGVDLLRCGFAGAPEKATVPEVTSAISRTVEVLNQKFEVLVASYGIGFFPQVGLAPEW